MKILFHCLFLIVLVFNHAGCKYEYEKLMDKINYCYEENMKIIDLKIALGKDFDIIYLPEGSFSPKLLKLFSNYRDYFKEGWGTLEKPYDFRFEDEWDTYYILFSKQDKIVHVERLVRGLRHQISFEKSIMKKELGYDRNPMDIVSFPDSENYYIIGNESIFYIDYDTGRSEYILRKLKKNENKKNKICIDQI